MNLTRREYEKSIETITTVTDMLEADFANIDELNQMNIVPTENTVAHLMIRKRPKSIQDLLEIRVAVVGNVDAGKVNNEKLFEVTLTFYIVYIIRRFNKRCIG